MSTPEILARDAQARADMVKNSITYAALRAVETGWAYIVSDFPRVLWDCPDNRRVLRDLGEKIVIVVVPGSDCDAN